MHKNVVNELKFMHKNVVNELKFMHKNVNNGKIWGYGLLGETPLIALPEVPPAIILFLIRINVSNSLLVQHKHRRYVYKHNFQCR